MKYQSWNGELSGRNPALYEYLEDGTIHCLGNRKGFEVHIPNRHPKKNGAVFFLVKDCSGCEFMPYCRRFMKEKEGSEKVFEVQPRFMQLKQKARDLLLTPEGIEMRVNRSCQVEGVFGIIKQDMTYTRFRRTSIERVSTEPEKIYALCSDETTPQLLASATKLSSWCIQKTIGKKIS